MFMAAGVESAGMEQEPVDESLSELGEAARSHLVSGGRGIDPYYLAAAGAGFRVGAMVIDVVGCMGASCLVGERHTK